MKFCPSRAVLDMSGGRSSDHLNPFKEASEITERGYNGNMTPEHSCVADIAV